MAGGDRFVGHPAGEKGFQSEFLALEVLQRYGIGEADNLNQLEILKLGTAGRHQVFHQRSGFRRPGGKEDAHAGAYPFENGVRGVQHIPPSHGSPPLCHCIDEALMTHLEASYGIFFVGMLERSP